MSERKVYCTIEITQLIPVRIKRHVIVRTDKDDIHGVLERWVKGKQKNCEADIEEDPSEQTYIVSVGDHLYEDDEEVPFQIITTTSDSFWPDNTLHSVEVTDSK